MFAIGAVVLVIATFALLLAGDALLSANATFDAGVGEIHVGDRYSDVTFAHRFDSPPVVTATAQTPTGELTLSLQEITPEGFAIELSHPAPTTIVFTWSATWLRKNDIKESAQSGALGVAYATLGGGRDFKVMIESTADDRPTSLLVPMDQLQALVAEDTVIMSAALDAARMLFNDQYTCSWPERVARRLRLRTRHCPAWGASLRATWRKADINQWSAVRSARGLQITLKEEQSAPTPWKDVVHHWSDLVRGSKAVDVAIHNNQVLDFMTALAGDGKLVTTTPMTIVHFDTHSDLWTFPLTNPIGPTEDISQWLNAAILAGYVNEVYWVMPDWTRNSPYAGLYSSKELPDTAQPYTSGPRDLDIFVDRPNARLYFGAPPAGSPAMPRVIFHKRTLGDLPDFSGNSSVFLEIDGDYFSNSGFDTELQGHSNPDRNQLMENLNRVAVKLASLHVRPQFTSWCVSPGYTAPEDELDEEHFFLDVLHSINMEDFMMGYAHSEPTGKLPWANNIRRETALQHFLFELRYQDFLQSNGDREINLYDSREVVMATALASQMLNLDAVHATQLLQRLDRFDGLADGKVNLSDVEYYWSLERTDPSAALFGSIL